MLKVVYRFIEIWAPNDTWRALYAEAPVAFAGGVNGAMERSAAAGISTLGRGTVEHDAIDSVSESSVAALTTLDLEATRGMEAGVEASRWYGSFFQQNVRSDLRPTREVLDTPVGMTA